MLIQSSKVIGLKVLTLDSGREVEDVDDVIYDPATHKVMALLVQGKGLFKDAKVIMLQDIQSIGPDKIIIQNENVIYDVSDLDNRIAGIARSDDYLTQTRVVTEQGEDLGKVVDLFFDSQNGSVTEFLVSQGALKNLQSGMKKIRLDEIVKVGEDATIVKGYTEALLEKQGEDQGLKGALNQAKEKAQELAENVKEKASEAKENIEKEVNKPETQDKLKDLRDDAESTIDQVKDKAREVGENLKSGAEDVKDDVKEKSEELTEEAKRKAAEANERLRLEQNKEVVGKYLTKDIFSLTDDLIAQKGDQITHELLSKAEANGVRDQVVKYSDLNNVEAETTNQAA